MTSDLVAKSSSGEVIAKKGNMEQKRVQSFVENTKCDGEPSNVFPLNPILREMIYLKSFTFTEYIFEKEIYSQCFFLKMNELYL